MAEKPTIRALALPGLAPLRSAGLRGVVQEGAAMVPGNQRSTLSAVV
jgi:hypothetical protein